MQLQPPWQLEPVSTTARLWLLALAVLLPMGIIAGTLAYTANDPTPKHLIPDNEAPTIAIVIGGTLLLCLVIHCVLRRPMTRHPTPLDDNGLALRTRVYRRRWGWNRRRAVTGKRVRVHVEA